MDMDLDFQASKISLFPKQIFTFIISGPILNLESVKTGFEPSRMFNRLVDEHELAVQLETMHLSHLEMARGPSYPSYLENTFDDQNPLEGKIIYLLNFINFLN